MAGFRQNVAYSGGAIARSTRDASVNINALQEDVAQRARTDSSGDIDTTVGGHLCIVGPMTRHQVNAAGTNFTLYETGAASATQFGNEWIMTRPGSILSIAGRGKTWTAGDEGTLHVRIHTSTDVTVYRTIVGPVITNSTDYFYINFPKDLHRFAAGEAIKMGVVTNSTWAATAADVHGQCLVEF